MMTSVTTYEQDRTKPYSQDLRWRVVWQVEGLRYTQSRVAKNLGIDKSTVCRIASLFRTTGSVSSKQYPKEKAFRKLTAPAQLAVLNFVVENPGTQLKEVQKMLSQQLLLSIDVSTICRFLLKSNFTYQKLSLIATQRSAFLRQKFMLDVSEYKQEMFVFIDETGTDSRKALRTHGYSLCGVPAKCHKPLVRGSRVSAIAAMSIEGIIDVKVSQGTNNGDTFYNFVETILLPHLQPFDGINSHSIVVMDNCSIHHTQEVVSLIEEVGVIVHFLPPYSPDLNPIEEAFSKVKFNIKYLERIMDMSDLEHIMLCAFAMISKQDCEGYISHCNIYNT